MIQGHPQLFGQGYGLRRGLQPDREDHHIKFLFDDLPRFTDVLQKEIVGFRHRIHGMDPGTDKTDPPFFLGPIVIFFEFLAVGAHIHKENGRIQGMRAVFLGNNRLLDGIHTANRRAVAVVAMIDVPGTDALEPGDLFRFLMV